MLSRAVSCFCPSPYRFNRFELEAHPRCLFDHVTIYDGNSQYDRELGKFCGNVLPPVIKSTGSSLLVVFISDGSVAKDGFLAAYRTTYGKLHRSHSKFFLRSNGFSAHCLVGACLASTKITPILCSKVHTQRTRSRHWSMHCLRNDVIGRRHPRLWWIHLCFQYHRHHQLRGWGQQWAVRAGTGVHLAVDDWGKLHPETTLQQLPSTGWQLPGWGLSRGAELGEMNYSYWTGFLCGQCVWERHLVNALPE